MIWGGGPNIWKCHPLNPMGWLRGNFFNQELCLLAQKKSGFPPKIFRSTKSVNHANALVMGIQLPVAKNRTGGVLVAANALIQIEER